MKVIAQGAEAKVYDCEGTIIKERPKKGYRHPSIDKSLRQFRTRREAKVIESLQKIGIPAPSLISCDDKDMKIVMTKIQGQPIVDCLEHDVDPISQQIGTTLGKMHANDIIHGDVTTSNMIRADEVHIIDFGLSFFSKKVEDKAVDLHCLRQALESKHHTVWEHSFSIILDAYKKVVGNQFETIMQRFGKVESRGRNKKH